MRKQIIVANWKMNLSNIEAESLVDEILKATLSLKDNQQVVFAVPFPYLINIKNIIGNKNSFFVAAQNCASTKNGAYTGEVSSEMLAGIGIKYVIIGHSERRLYNHEDNKVLKQKVDLALESNIHPIFCCGESLGTRESNNQNTFVEHQLRESLFQLTTEQIKKVVIAYEPIWAIGTGKTATSEEAQEMHAHIRKVLSTQFGITTAESISILYGGSVKGSNAEEIFNNSDVDGGLIGGASLNATEFLTIIKSLK